MAEIWTAGQCSIGEVLLASSLLQEDYVFWAAFEPQLSLSCKLSSMWPCCEELQSLVDRAT